MSEAFQFERVDLLTGHGRGGMPLPFEFFPWGPERMADREVWFPPAHCFIIDRESGEIFLHKAARFDDCRELPDDGPRVGLMRVDPIDQSLPGCFLIDLRYVASEQLLCTQLKKTDVYNPFDYWPILGIVYTNENGAICYQGDARLQERAGELVTGVDTAREEAGFTEEEGEGVGEAA